MTRIVIVGGGVSGLSLAYRLQQSLPDAEVLVLEQRDRPGGSLWTERRDGFQVEIGPNGFLDNKPTTVDLCRDVGLGEQLLPASEASGKNRYLFLDGRLRLLPNSLPSLLGTDLLRWRSKLGLLMERVRPRRRESGEESVDAFVRRRAGPEFADVFADAFVTGIFAGDPRRLSVQAAFPRFAEFEAKHGSLIAGMFAAMRERRAAAKARGEPYRRVGMWSFRDGLRLLAETLRDRLRTTPLLGVAVRRVERDGPDGWAVCGDGRDRWTADTVVLTCPAYAQAELLAPLDAELAGEVNGIEYNRVAVVALGFRKADVPHPLDGFGYIAPQRTRRDLLGVQWCSSIFPARAPDGAVLLRALCGGVSRPEIVGWDDVRLVNAVRDEMRLAAGVTAEPNFSHIVRWERAIPQYNLGHLDRVARIEARLAHHPGLFLGGNAYRGVALNDCTEQGQLVAAAVADYLRRGKPSGPR
jgi:protoporphyrinogen/coproporphyrinogen III oxidase